MSPNSASEAGVYKIVVDFASDADNPLFTDVTDLDNSCFELVRRVKAGTNYHEADDYLSGEAIYGTWVKNGHTEDSSFSKRWKDTHFTKFLFSSGDFTYWMLMDKSALDTKITGEISFPKTSSSTSAASNFKAYLAEKDTE